ncbi:MAG TPA: hypothetical protein VF202_02385 [Trueperaceae bacterium]
MTRWQMFTEWLDEVRRERRERAALARAAEAFSRLHPAWHGALFDGPFLRRFEPRELLAMDPLELAREWSRQFAFADARRREREVARAAEAAASLKDLLAEELRRAEERQAAKPLAARDPQLRLARRRGRARPAARLPS